MHEPAPRARYIHARRKSSVPWKTDMKIKTQGHRRLLTWQRQLAVVVEAKGKDVAIGSGGKGGVGATVDVHNLVAHAAAAQ